jgi:hypothetical protein
MAKPHLKLVSPATVNRTVTPTRPPNTDLRTREYLTAAEVERLIEVVKGNRYGHRDAAMILVAYRYACGSPSLWTCGGSRWSSKQPPCTSAGSSRALQARIRSSVTSCAPCGDYSVSRSRIRLSCSPRSGARHSPPLASPGWWSVRAPRPSSASRHTRTCPGTPAAMPWPTGGTTRGRCKPTSGTRTSNTRCAIPNCRRRASKISGEGDALSKTRAEGTASFVS